MAVGRVLVAAALSCIVTVVVFHLMHGDMSTGSGGGGVGGSGSSGGVTLARPNSISNGSTTTTSTTPGCTRLAGQAAEAIREQAELDVATAVDVQSVEGQAGNAPEGAAGTTSSSSAVEQDAPAAAETAAQSAAWTSMQWVPWVQSLLQSAARVRKPPTFTAEEIEAYSNSPDADFDIIYTWVNGSEETHVANRIKYGGPKRATQRDAERGELMYSLRSLDMYMPWWKGTLYFVHTNLPCWLDLNHPRLKLIHHRDIFMWPEQTLPTFNSDVIEAFFHRIPGLRKHVVYMNDDVFLTRPSKPSDFFHNGKAVLYFESHTLSMNPYTAIAMLRNLPQFSHLAKLYHTQLAFQGKFNSRKHREMPFHPLRHGPIPLDRDRLAELWTYFGQPLKESVRHRFRHPETIAPMLMHHLVCLAATPDECEEASLAQTRAAAYYPIGSLGDDGLMSMMSKLLFRPPQFMTTNDVRGESELSPRQQDEEFFWVFNFAIPALYPSPSQWEQKVRSC